MTLRTATRAFVLPAAAAVAVVVVALHYGRGSAVGLGAVLAGTAAVIEALTRANAANRKVDGLVATVNGGLARAAREHVQDNEVVQGLVHRLDRIEHERDECHEERRKLHERLIVAIAGHDHEPGGEQE
jgi:hypothetical protein